MHMTRPEIAGISPFFIVQDAARALSFYRDQLGFEVTFQGFGDDLFFGIVRRGAAMIMFKDVGVDPLPNYRREPAARWDDNRAVSASDRAASLQRW
jgi:catechol 2,3-dioxygenase-like lactoylglutathione lyase family enzyme